MRKLCIVFSIAILPLLGSAQENRLFNYIPKDANSVVHIDLTRMILKLPASSLKSSFFYKELMKHPQASFLTMLGDSRKSGIDYTKGIMLIMKQNQGRMRGMPSISVFVKLDDPTTFTERIKELIKETGTIKTYGTNKIIVSEGGMSCGWNNDVFVLTSEYDQSIMTEFYTSSVSSDTTITLTMPMDTTTSDVVAIADTSTNDSPGFDYKNYEADYKKLMEKVQRSKRDACFELLTPKKFNTTSQDPEFISVMNENADIKTWSYQGEMNFPVELFSMAPFLKNLQSISGKKGTSVMNFENGKIVVQGRNFPEGALAELYKSQPATTNTNNNLIGRAPKEGRFGLFSLSLDAEFAKGLKKEFSLEELFAKANEDAEGDDKFDFSLLNGALKSQAMVVLMNNNPDPSTETDEYSQYRYKGPVPLVAIEIADLQKFEALKAAILKSTTKNGGHMQDEDRMVIKNNDKIAVLTTNDKMADEFLAGSGNEIPSWISSHSDYPFVGNLDFISLFNALTKPIDQGQPKKPFENILNNTLDQLYFYSGKYEEGVVKTSFEISFTDKNKNAFEQLFDLMNKFGQLMMKGEETMNMDGFNNSKIKIQEVTLSDVREEELEIVPPPPPPPQKTKKKN